MPAGTEADSRPSLLHVYLQGGKLLVHLHADAAELGTQALQLFMAALDLGHLLLRERIRRLPRLPAGVCPLGIRIPRSRSACIYLIARFAAPRSSCI